MKGKRQNEVSCIFLSSCFLALQHIGCAFGEHMVMRNFSLRSTVVLLEPAGGGLIPLVTTTTYSCATRY